MITPANDDSLGSVQQQDDLQTSKQTPQSNNNDNKQWGKRLSQRPERKSNPLPRNSKEYRKSILSPSASQKKKSFSEEFKSASKFFNLDPTVASKIDQLRSKKRVAFLSGAERTYYPEEPGHTRFALKFQASLPDPTIPSPMFYVDPLEDDRLNKPISTKGFGMGGLSAPRFAKQHGEAVPAPNQYQSNIKELLLRHHRFPPQVWQNYGLLGPEDKFWDDKVSRKLFNLWGQCHQINVAFGRTVKESRFQKNETSTLLGPGSYPIRQMKEQRPQVINAFLRGPSMLNPTTKLHCSYKHKDTCLECEEQLMSHRDYYRSRFHVNLTPIRPLLEDKEEDILRAIELKNSTHKIKKKAKRVLLCRECYCKALRGKSRYWKTRAEVLWLFEKTRHCSYIHEHNGIPEYTLKASCYWTRRLARRESVLSKHYTDKCSRKLVEKKQKHQS